MPPLYPFILCRPRQEQKRPKNTNKTKAAEELQQLKLLELLGYLTFQEQRVAGSLFIFLVIHFLAI